MKISTVQQQIDNLRPLVKTGLALNFHNWLVACAVLLVILSVFLWNPIPLMMAIFLGVVGMAERSAGPNMAAAIKAYDTIKATSGKVTIGISCWDTDNHYHARVQENGQPDWEYEFIPQGWEPAAGCFAARIWRSDDSGPPVLTIVEGGILIPRYNPSSPQTVPRSSAAE
ncbi:hypothetical protein [Desulfosarcina sp.]|uniref:hypothetical protein n=1 Tax=Desulfosarcina sp. TaxID=2027861 RepID=UPI003568EE87